MNERRASGRGEVGLTNDELELFARHLSLPHVGMSGQARLLATRIVCTSDEPWARALRRALQRAGLQVQEGGEAELVVGRQVLVAPYAIAVGCVLPEPSRGVPPSPPALWLGALIASEIILWRLGLRPERFSVALDFPNFRLVAG